MTQTETKEQLLARLVKKSRLENKCCAGTCHGGGVN